jgi:hypothetical protein
MVSAFLFCLNLSDIAYIAVLVYLAFQLSKQKKNDFKPRNDDISFARVNTDPCTACCEMLEKFRDAAKENISGKNLEYLLNEIGISFHRCVHSSPVRFVGDALPSQLLEHLRKFSVNATGGLMLAKYVYLRWSLGLVN